jgi:alcohol dehydrogenase class IV
MKSFNYEAKAIRVLFGQSTISQVDAEAARAGVTRAIVLSTPNQLDEAARVAGYLGPAHVSTFTGAAMHTPEDVTECALEIARSVRADGIVAVGGGSTIGLSKAIAIRTGLPQIVLPTTYAGSEMTAILGQTRNGVKTTRSDPRVLPKVVIYDIDLTLSLPVGVSASSGLNAIAHAAEALYARDSNPVISLMAEEGIAALSRSLPAILARPDDIEARSDALYGAWLCGTCLGSVGMALHHKICHTLGGTFNLPHAETHAIILPHVLAFNAPTVPDAMQRMARALGAADAIQGLNALCTRLGIARSLHEIGMPEEGIARAAELVVSNAYWNPRLVDRTQAQELIRRAWHGHAAREME